jgi:hypothetical protein
VSCPGRFAAPNGSGPAGDAIDDATLVDAGVIVDVIGIGSVIGAVALPNGGSTEDPSDQIKSWD